METVQNPSPRNRRIARGWLALLAALLVYALLVLLDQHLKRAPHPGFRPEQASCTAFAPDAPQTWMALKRLPAAKTVRDELPRWVHQAELALRLATGIRPEPERWRVWLGPQMLASIRDGQWGVCVRPGVLLHAAHWANRLVASSVDGFYTYRGLRYAWREGFLVASPWPEYVRAALQAAPCANTGAESRPDGVSLVWNNPVPGEALLVPGDLELRGRLTVSIPHTPESLRLPDAWPNDPMLTVSMQRLDALSPFWSLFADTAAAQWLERHGTALVTAWRFPALPDNWDARLSEAALALYDVDISEITPVPECAAALRDREAPGGTHPLAPLLTGDHPIPYAWNAHPGQILPVFGEKCSLCLAGDEGYWLVTTQEPLMGRLLGHLSPRPAPANTFALRLNCKKAGGLASNVLRRAAALELIPEMDPRDLEREWLPAVHVISQLGRLSVDASSDGKQVIFAARLSEDGHE